MPTDLDELRRLAEAAIATRAEAVRVAELPTAEFSARAYDTAQFAAKRAEVELQACMNSDTVLALLTEVDRLRAALADAKACSA